MSCSFGGVSIGLASGVTSTDRWSCLVAVVHKLRRWTEELAKAEEKKEKTKAAKEKKAKAAPTDQDELQKLVDSEPKTEKKLTKKQKRIALRAAAYAHRQSVVACDAWVDSERLLVMSGLC